MRKPTQHLGFLLVMTAGLLLTGVATVAAGSPSQSMGRIPDAAFAGGALDLTQVPDFVSTLGRDGSVVGYVSRDRIIDPSAGKRDVLGRPIAGTWPVYAEDLETVVGHLVPDRGFVPIGVDPASVPAADVRVGPGE